MVGSATPVDVCVRVYIDLETEPCPRYTIVDRSPYNTGTPDFYTTPSYPFSHVTSCTCDDVAVLDWRDDRARRIQYRLTLNSFLGIGAPRDSGLPSRDLRVNRNVHTRLSPPRRESRKSPLSPAMRSFRDWMKSYRHSSPRKLRSY